jgi:hypothetical protein
MKINLFLAIAASGLLLRGTAIAQEKKIKRSDLPPAVEKTAGKGKILKVESLTKKGKLVAYEAQVDTNGKKSEIQVGPEGKPLDHEE